MSTSAPSLHNKRLPSETALGQKVPDIDAAQQLKLRERQRFFEEVFQHDVDVYLSSAHLQIDYKRPPLGSVSSMEVNVDMLEQMELLDISDQEALDVFLSTSGEEGVQLASPPPVHGINHNNHDGIIKHGLHRYGHTSCDGMSRVSSTSSTSSSDSQNPNKDGGETPVVQSDDEDVHADSFPGRDTEKDGPILSS